jgi:hypothetical protein
MATIPQQDTAGQIGQAAQLKKYNDIPIDILPNDSFGRLYKPGTKTLGGKTLDENTRQYGLTLQEEKRAAQARETLAQKEYEEMVRSNKADESYKWASLNSRGNGGAAPTQTEILNSIRNGAVQYAQGLTKGEPFQASRGLLKGQTFTSSGMGPQEAATSTIQMLQGKLGELPISSSNYNDIVNQVYVSLGLPVPKNSQAPESLAESIAQMQAKLGM